ncbi:Hsp20/alpha crystallin family protein [Candidatus Parcubacteria bacterium]|nr:MAG: Hsp20/alpha crystallin family protein [Candidatus Parcubacteria bacterium]
MARKITIDPYRIPRIFSLIPSIWDEDYEPTMYEGLDIYETNDEIVIKAPVPGIPEENVDISFENGILRIHARSEETEEEKKKKKAVHKQQMIRHFDYTTTLPRMVDPDKITAEVEGGIITITAPISEAAKPKKISLRSMKTKQK